MTAHGLRLRPLGLDTHHEHVLYMRRCARRCRPTGRAMSQASTVDALRAWRSLPGRQPLRRLASTWVEVG